MYIIIIIISPAPASHSSLSAGEGGEEMEGGVAGAASEDDGGKAVTRRVKARAAAPGNREEGPRRRGQGRGGEPRNHMRVTAEEFSGLNGTFTVILFSLSAKLHSYIHNRGVSVGLIPVKILLLF